MDDKIIRTNKQHRINLDGRKKAEITGVNDVISFDLAMVLLETENGMLTIKGSNLHVNRLSVDKGEVDVDGQIDSILYSDVNSFSKKNESVFGRLFK